MGKTGLFNNISTIQFSWNLQWLQGHGMSIIHKNLNLQRKIKHDRTKMDDIENGEERLPVPSCYYGQTI